MNNVMIEVPVSINTFVKRLTLQDKIKLAEKLARETRRQRWEKLFSSIDKKAAKNPISQKEINQAIKETRKELYG